MARKAANKRSITTGHPPANNPHGPFRAITASPSVDIEGSPAVRLGDKYPAHAPDFVPTTPVIEGSSKVFINGKPAARVGDRLACQDRILTGSSKVEIG